MNNLCVGVLGPVALNELRDILPAPSPAGGCLDGLGGSPVQFHVRELLRRGSRVTLFTLDPTVVEEQVFETDNLKICVGPYTAHRGRHYFSRERAYLLQALRREKPDVLSAHWTYEFALAAVASGIPHVVTAHDAPWQVLRHNFIPYRMVRTAMAYHASWRAQRMVAVSPHVADHLRRFGFRADSVDVIPNGLPSPMLRQSTPHHVGTASIFASVFSGGWQGLKNGPSLIEAFAGLRLKLPQARLLMVGDQCGPTGSAAAWARARGMDAGIEFLGRLAQARIAELMATEIDILVHPSLEESFGMPLIEAGAMGVPVIAGQGSGAVPWILEHGKNGVLVDVRSPRSIARAMLELAEDAQRRTDLGQAANATVRQRFDISRSVDRYEEIFAQLTKA